MESPEEEKNPGKRVNEAWAYLRDRSRRKFPNGGGIHRNSAYRARKEEKTLLVCGGGRRLATDDKLRATRDTRSAKQEDKPEEFGNRSHTRPVSAKGDKKGTDTPT